MDLLMPAESRPRRGRRKSDPSKLTPAEKIIVERMKRIDKNEGYHGTVERLGRGYLPEDPSFCKSYTRRLIASLRRKGFVVFAGITSGGTNVYLQPDRPTYKREDVPICLGRPSPYGWDVDPSRALFTTEPPQIAEPYLVDGYPIPSKVRQSYRPEVVLEAVRRIKETYAGREQEIRNRAGLLIAMCKLVHQKHKPRPAPTPGALAAPSAEPRPPVDRTALEALASGADPALRRLAEQLLRDAGGEAGPRDERATGPEPAAPQLRAVAAPGAPRQDPDALTIGQLLDMWRKSVELGIAPATKGAYAGKLANLQRLLGEQPAALITLDELVLYIDRRQREGGVQAVTVGKELSILRRALRYGAARQLLPTGIEVRVPQCKGRSAPRMRWLTVEEYQKLIAILPTDRADWIRVAVQTGARKGEMARLQRSDVRWSSGQLHIRGTKTIESDRTVPLTDDVREVANRCIDGPLVRPWHNADRDLRQATKRLGIAPVSANDLRRTYCTWLLISGMPADRVARLLGHTDLRLVHKVYGRITGEHLGEAVDHIRKMLGRAPREAPN